MLGAAVSMVTMSAATEGPLGDGAAATVLAGAVEALAPGTGAEPPVQAAVSKRQGANSRAFMVFSRVAGGDARPVIPLSIVVRFAAREPSLPRISAGR